MNVPNTTSSLTINKSTYSSPSSQTISSSTNRTLFLNSTSTTTTTAINIKPAQTSNSSYNQLLHYQSYVPPPPSPLSTTSVRPILAATSTATNNSINKSFSSTVINNPSPSKIKVNSTKKFVSSR